MNSNMKSLAETFERSGYLVVPNFINEKKVALLRNLSSNLLDQEMDSTLKPTSFLKNYDLTKVVFDSKFVNVLNKLNHSYRYFLPNFTVRRDLYIGWHTDDEFTNLDQEKLPGVLQCNIYLQPNSIDKAGGIDISPGTHHLSKTEKKKLISSEDIAYETVKTQAGDLLIFDYRVVHRSSPPVHQEAKSESRLALQWTVCKSKQKALMFMQYLLRRQKEKLHLSDFTDKRALGYFFDAANVEFPTSFDVSTQALISLSNITIPSFSEIGGV